MHSEGQMVHSDQVGGAFGLVHSGNGAFSPTPYWTLPQAEHMYLFLFF